MFKLTIISGPNRGSQFTAQDGEITIGRHTSNTIVLPSTKVSKKHCSLRVAQQDLSIRDEGSSNGTFVNGVLTKSKKLKAGDRISVGDFVLEVSALGKKGLQNAPALVGFANAGGGLPATATAPGKDTPMDLGAGMGGMSMAVHVTLSSLMDGVVGDEAPKDIPGKIIWGFEKKVMPHVYSYLLKYEWKMVALVILGILIFLNLILSVQPLVESGRQTMIVECKRRATLIARQIVEKNLVAMAARAETKTDLGSLDKEEGVLVAVLTDLELRVIAPGNRMGQYLTAGSEAKFATRAKNLFRKGRETGLVDEVSENVIVAIEPLKVFAPQLGKNVVTAMAVVSIDASLSTPDLGETSMVYSQTLIYTGLLTLLVGLILYRLTIKPINILNDDLDKVLKGDAAQVTKEFKFEELSSLMDNINSALQRMSKGDSSGGAAAFGATVGTSEEYANAVKVIGLLPKTGLVIFGEDRKVLHLNPYFEEASGIRSENAIGQDVPGIARDQAFVQQCSDLFEKAQVGAEAIAEESEFSGIPYKLYFSAYGTVGAVPKCYALMIVKKED